MFSAFRRLVSETIAYRNVLVQLVRQQLLLRYRRTTLGYFWTLFNPLLMMTVTAVVFANLFKQDLATFAIFLFAGMLPWNCFHAMVTQSTVAFIHNEGLIKKIYLPKILFPLSVCTGILIDSMLSMVVLSAIILTLGGDISWSLLFLPLAYLLLFIFALGVALLSSVATVFFFDLQHVVVILMQALFFLSPVLYEKKDFGGSVAWLMKLNPVGPFIELFRAPILHASWPSLALLTHATGLAVLSLSLGLAFFLRHEKKIVFRL